MTARCRRPAHGFTLIEVLAALTVASMVLLLIGQMQRLGIGAIARQADLMHNGRDLRQADDLIRQALNHMDPGTRARPEVPRGTGSRILFKTRHPGLAQGGGDTDGDPPTVCELAVDDEQRLILRCAASGSAAARRDMRLAQGVAALELRYTGGENQAVWLATWAGPGNPRLIRARVIWTNPNRRPWPAIVVSPPLLEPGD